MPKDNLRNLKYTLERYYIPIKILLGSPYKFFPTIDSKIQKIVKSIETNLHKANTYKLFDRCAKIVNVNHILSYIYNYQLKNKDNDKLIYMVYIVFNGTLKHMIHSVVFHNNWNLNTEEYLCDSGSWKELIPKLEKMQSMYEGKIRMDICIDYTRSTSVDIKPLYEGKQQDFFNQFGYKTAACMRIDSYLEKPSSAISQWLQEQFKPGANDGLEHLIHDSPPLPN